MIKKFETYINDLSKLVDLSKIKKYIIFTEFNDYYLDEILDIDKHNDTIKIKNLYFYNNLTNNISRPDEIANIYFISLNDLVFSSDNFDEIKKHFDSAIEIFKNTNKYNL